MQETSPAPAPSAEVVGNAFVEQYYHILHQSPELVHKFYQDSSLLSRPDADGIMTTVTTMQVRNFLMNKITSLFISISLSFSFFWAPKMKGLVSLACKMGIAQRFNFP